jgi:thiamine-monophosphate kinase
MVDRADGEVRGSMNSLGEKGFLHEILPGLYEDPRLVGGFGHDASVIELPGAPFNLIQKIDRASHPVALKRGWADHGSWGRMAVTANCSDILASGGEPVSCMVAVMVPGEKNADHVRDIIVGASKECRERGIVYAGGDTKEAADAHVVGCCVGIIPKDGFLPRNTAKPGDRIFCAGRIGGFAGAYFLMEKVHGNTSSEETRHYTDYLSLPVAQWEVAREVNSRGVARCGMDASDGVLDVLRTLTAPGVGVELHLDRIPYHAFALECAAKTEIPLTQFIFGGGDWNILYAVPPEAAEQLTAEVGDRLPLFEIGEVTEGKGVWARGNSGERLPVTGVVNEHFVSRIEDAAGFMDHIERGSFVGWAQVQTRSRPSWSSISM